MKIKVYQYSSNSNLFQHPWICGGFVYRGRYAFRFFNKLVDIQYEPIRFKFPNIEKELKKYLWYRKVMKDIQRQFKVQDEM